MTSTPTANGDILSEYWEGANAITSGTGSADQTGWVANNVAVNGDKGSIEGMPSQGTQCLEITGGNYQVQKDDITNSPIVYAVFDFQTTAFSIADYVNIFAMINNETGNGSETAVRLIVKNDGGYHFQAGYYDGSVGGWELSTLAVETNHVYRFRIKYDYTNKKVDFQVKNVTDAGSYEAWVDNKDLTTPTTQITLVRFQTNPATTETMTAQFDYIDLDSLSYLR